MRWVLLLALLFRAALASELASFQAGTGGWQLGTLGVADIVGDQALEIVVPYRDNNGVWKLDAFDWHGNRLAGFPYVGGSAVINVSPTLYDLDGDGKAEIFFTSGASIVALKGNGSVLWVKPVSSLNYVPDSGFQAVTNGFYMSPLGVFQPFLPVTAQFFSEVSPPMIADLSGKGVLELLTAWKINPDPLLGQQDYNPFINDYFGGSEWGLTGESWSGGVIAVDARTGAQTLTYHFHQLVESGLAVGQADDDPAREVYVLNDADSVVAFDRTKPPGFFGKGMLHKMFGKNQRLLSGSYLKGVDIYAADVDGDGHDEVLVASSQIEPNWQPSETMLDDDGAILWRKWLDANATSFPETWGWFNSACIIPVNPDHDNRIDILSFTQSTTISFRSWNGTEFVDRPGWPKDFAPRLPTPPVVGDIDGDGQEEIIIGTYDPAANPSTGSLYIFALDGTQKLTMNVPGGLKHIPSIADVNGDGSVDLVYRALDGKVYVQNFGAKPGASISWATHRGNARRDGNMGANLFPPGTPILNFKAGASRYADFMWRAPAGFYPTNYIIERALQPNLFASYGAGLTNAEHFPVLNFGDQNVFQIRAVYATGPVRSAPFAITTLRENNLIANGGFEENDNSHWDKWFSGDIPWDRMTVSTNGPAAGAQCMEIKLVNDSSQSSITQYSHYGIPESYLKTVPGVLYSFGGYIRSGGLSAASEHWLEWDSSPTGEDPTARPPLPWPDYFTPSLKADTNPTAWTYLNRVFQMPAGFPNVQLRHRFTVNGAASGSVFLDNIFFSPLPPTNDTRWIQLMPFGQRWRYLTNTPPANWFATSFNDSNWPEAPAKFGAGTGPQHIVTPLPSQKPAYYFRRSFSMAQTNLTTLLLAATCTDDYNGTVYPVRLWLNGTEIVAPIEAVSGEGNIVKYFDLTPFVPLFKKTTANELAIQLQNAWAADWDNVAFDVSLIGIAETGVSTQIPHFISVARSVDTSIQLRMGAQATSTWLLESSDELKTWAPVATIAFDGGGIASTNDTGQNGRPFPSAVSARFYRLRSP
jgi:hypothetical protein